MPEPQPHTEPAAAAPPAWDGRWAEAWARCDACAELAPARVVRIDKGGITVATSVTDERLVVAAKSARRVVVGDVCGLDAAAGRVEVILARRTVFERRSPGAARDDVAVEAKALAANMDVVLVLQPLDAGVNLHRLAREVVLAHASGATPVVVLTKADLVDDARAARERSEASRFSPGVPVVCCSTTRGPSGLADLLEHLPPGTVAALLGASGAGKSTLANALAGHDVQLTAEVREGDRRGRHTTTAGQMLPLDGNRWLIDTPGIRGVGLWEADDALDAAFTDIVVLAETCRFRDCTHDAEPGCAVQAAVADGRLGADRLEVWHALSAELDTLHEELEEHVRGQEREANQRSRRRAARLSPDGSSGNLSRRRPRGT